MKGRSALALASVLALGSSAPAAALSNTSAGGPASARSASARELEIPKNDAWVTDLAGLISPSKEDELEALMESYRTGSTHEIAVLTIPSLEGDSIERFALRVGRAWGLGTEEKNNGALLVVAEQDRALRIEVGRGLEGELTDSRSGRIIRDVITPEFRQGRFEEGIEAGVRAMHAVIGGDYAALPEGSGATDVGVLSSVVPFLVLLLVLWMLTRRGTRGRRGLPWMFPTTFGGGGFGGFSGGGFGGRGGGGGGGFRGFGGGGGFSGGGASGRW